MCQLDEATGLTLSSTYRNDKWAKEFVSAIALNERHGLSMIVQESNFLSMISDRATDSAHTKDEICLLKLAARELYQNLLA